MGWLDLYLVPGSISSVVNCTTALSVYSPGFCLNLQLYGGAGTEGPRPQTARDSTHHTRLQITKALFHLGTTGVLYDHFYDIWTFLLNLLAEH